MADRHVEFNEGDFSPEDIEAVRKIPVSGIAFRGDQLGHTAGLKTEGLKRKSANFIIALPPKDLSNPKEAVTVAHNIKMAVRWAFSYADPQGSPSYRMPPDFIDFTRYFQIHKDRVYTLSWFTSPKPDLFRHIFDYGHTWAGDEGSNHVTGDIWEYGPIPARNVMEPIVTNHSDIVKAQEIALARGGLVRPGQKQITHYLSYSGRWDFNNALADIATKKLFAEIRKKF